MTSLHRGDRIVWRMFALSAVLLLLVGGLVFALVKETSDARRASEQNNANSVRLHAALNCVAAWANADTLHLHAVEHADTAQRAALDRLVRSIKSGPVAFQRALDAYLHAADHYQRQVRARPLPPAPRFACDDVTDRVLHSPTSAPTVTRTRTVTAPPRTKTRTVTIPGPRVTVPGPVRTRTRTVIVCRMPNGRACR